MNKLQILIVIVFLLGLVGCEQSPSNSDATSTESKTIESARSNPTPTDEKSQTSQPQNDSQTKPSPAANNGETKPPESNSPATAPTSQPESMDETTDEATPNPTPTASDDRAKPTQTKYDFKPDEEPIVPIGNFEFQLKQASLKPEIVDPSTQKRFSAKTADRPSSYLFVELNLTNKSDRTAFDLFRYQLDCGEGKLLPNAADAAVAYRNTRNLNVFAEIQPGATGTISDGFLVPDSCLASDAITLKISSAGEGEGEIPLRLK
ncbi:MAG TPA: hypothetical protein IGS17_12100 [Oscillatoriales cyanobacterium M59_W2019_021]|nr:MAG: hypothetical protein D6728_08570 [Cyanobacteria bacterium J055]HIK33937.1 hypothetical protein [Oscillatoriales cyanobacterium M4454_W2019_049]HIK51644.1 hypothetical protein [Oscillatoriales cyanobacterium M59_W2019_021]